MAELSPESQLVLDAAWEEAVALGAYKQYPAHRKVLAVAIRAALEVIIPEHRENHPNTLDERYRKLSAFDTRQRFLAMATELEDICG
jgi:hypothetical protein